MNDNTNQGRIDTVYLDMIGGIAGDMFLAAMADLEPSLPGVYRERLSQIPALPDDISVKYLPPADSGRLGSMFRVIRDDNKQTHHPHMAYSKVKEIVAGSALEPAVRARAEDIFEHLARSEAKVHGLQVDEVVFHEVGGWDSIVDVILAAAVIEYFSGSRWSCGPVPLGSGTVQCEHGSMPVPAPATAELLQGFDVYQDEFPGERVTPTGAAILRHLAPEQQPALPTGRLLGTGAGYGNRRFDGLENVLRCYRILLPATPLTDEVAVIEFDIDDQTPEDLAIALDAIREQTGALDVVQTPIVGKKGRLASSIRVLAEVSYLQPVADACLAATSTLGVRWYRANRRILDRHSRAASIEGNAYGIKETTRPDGRRTRKVESDDLARHGESYGTREAVRASAGQDDNENDE